MDNIIDLMDNRDFQALAIEKINKELEACKGDRYVEAVKHSVADTLREFCGKSKEFATVVYKTKRTLLDCIKAAMKGVTSSISDIEVYRRVAKFYFPNSEVGFQMTITVGEEPDEKYLNKESKKPAAEKTEQKPKAEKPGSKPKPKKETKPKEEDEPECIQISLF